MTCAMCSQPIEPHDEINLHHPVYRSEGGTEVEPVHKSCHVEFHSRAGDFRTWGRVGGQITAATRRWAFNLKGVRTHPAHDINRSFYAAHYAR